MRSPPGWRSSRPWAPQDATRSDVGRGSARWTNSRCRQSYGVTKSCICGSTESTGAGKDMCGFTGFLQRSDVVAANAMASVVTTMSDTLRYRGPDDAGAWTDAAAGIALGHRRLSIIDLSPEGHQPMVSP